VKGVPVKRTPPIACALAVLVLGCGTEGQVPLEGRPWKLLEIGGAAPAAEAGIMFGTDGRYQVQPGCNSGGGSYTLDGDRISLGETTLTAMGCGEPADGQERAFLAVLGGSPTFQVERQTGRLRIVSESEALVFEAP
jgi:heat shock protein HslJ